MNVRVPTVVHSIKYNSILSEYFTYAKVVFVYLLMHLNNV